MEKLLYQMIFKRKSFHLFRETEKIPECELADIKERCSALKPLVPDIKTAVRIVPAGETLGARGAEYCILLYSEKKDNYLQNVGYIGEQMDLYLASLNIGALWLGMGKVKEKEYNGLDFVIMIAIAKVKPEKFRKDMYKSKRRPLAEVWNGEAFKELGDVARFAPSACNSQPWKVEARESALSVYRCKSKRGIMPAGKVEYYNRIDMGIFLLFLELCLKNDNIRFERELFSDVGDVAGESTLAAQYKVNKKA